MGEYEPDDSRQVTGTGGPSDASQAGKVPGQQNQELGHGQDWRSQEKDARQQNSGQQGQGSGQMQQYQNDGSGQTGSSAGASGGYGGAAAGGFRDQVREHMNVIGADGVHVGTVDSIDGDRIKLTKRDSGAGFEGGSHEGHHHYLPLGLVAGIEGDTVRLSANGDVAYGFKSEEGDRT